jgi:hypothetical protein
MDEPMTMPVTRETEWGTKVMHPLYEYPRWLEGWKQDGRMLAADLAGRTGTYYPDGWYVATEEDA